MGAITVDGPTISANALPLIADAFGASRIDAPRAFDACGLGRPAATMPLPDAIPLSQFAQLMQCAGDAGDDEPRLWLTGHAIAAPALSHLFPAAGAERRLGALLASLVAELDALQHGSDFQLAVEGDLCTLTYRIVDPRIWPRSRDAEFTLGFFDGVIRRAVGAGDFLEAVAFEHRRDARGDVARLTRVPPIFEEPVNLIAFPAGLLDRPVDGEAWAVAPDPAAERPVRVRRPETARPEPTGRIEAAGAARPAPRTIDALATGRAPPPTRSDGPGRDAQARAPAASGGTGNAAVGGGSGGARRSAGGGPPTGAPEPDIATALYRRLGRGPVSQQQIARDCGLSERSLRRRLRDAGLSFRALAEAARIDYAEWALAATDLPLAEIAFRAGYADQSAFSRAFRRKTGLAPRARRGRHRASGPAAGETAAAGFRPSPE